LTDATSDAVADAADRAVAASTFRLDVKGIQIRQAFTAAGIRAVLLKGPTLAHLLYGDSRTRSYSDIDLLVSPETLPRAESILRAQGFRRFENESSVRATDASVGRAVGAHGASHGVAWLRDRDNFVVDLHDSLPQVGASQSVTWQHLTEHLEVLDVAGEEAEVLDRPASALLVALHAAHHGPGWDRSISDLERALEVFDLSCWQAAGSLATKLQAELSLGVGLGLIPAGQQVAESLRLRTEPTAAHRAIWGGMPWAAGVLEELLCQGDWGASIRVIARIVCPSPEALRRGSALARRSRRGLTAAYFLRPLQLARRLPVSLVARRRRLS
jgi:Uncharacterised nucleotidyltransferase